MTSTNSSTNTTGTTEEVASPAAQQLQSLVEEEVLSVGRFLTMEELTATGFEERHASLFEQAAREGVNRNYFWMCMAVGRDPQPSATMAGPLGVPHREAVASLLAYEDKVVEAAGEAGSDLLAGEIEAMCDTLRFLTKKVTALMQEREGSHADAGSHAGTDTEGGEDGSDASDAE